MKLDPHRIVQSIILLSKTDYSERILDWHLRGERLHQSTLALRKGKWCCQVICQALGDCRSDGTFWDAYFDTHNQSPSKYFFCGRLPLDPRLVLGSQLPITQTIERTTKYKKSQEILTNFWENTYFTKYATTTWTSNLSAINFGYCRRYSIFWVWNSGMPTACTRQSWRSTLWKDYKD